MVSITPMQRLRWGATLTGVSVLLLLGMVVSRTTLLATDGKGEESSTAILSQYRSNYSASTIPTLSVPTQTNIAISFPSEMRVDETRRVNAKVERYTVGLDFPTDTSTTEPHFEKKLDPIKSLGADVEVKLLSSGFDVQGLSTQKAGAPFPLNFTWTISPKKEGTHELLIDLSEIVRDARSDSSRIGTTNVRAGELKIDLKDGVVLPLSITVMGQFGVPTWLISAGASIPGFFGFVLTYRLFVEWLKKRKPKLSSSVQRMRRKRHAAD